MFWSLRRVQYGSYPAWCTRRKSRLRTSRVVGRIPLPVALVRDMVRQLSAIWMGLPIF